MHLEIPKFTRCCYCVPLRYGIITLGYLYLAYGIFIISVELYFDFDKELSSYGFGFIRGAYFVVERWLVFLIHIVEIAFIIVLIIGAHLKKEKLIVVYYYYGITTTLAAFATYLLVSFKDALKAHSYPLLLLDLSIMFSCIVLQVYLLLLIRSELWKPREALRYVNHLAEVSVQPHAQENGSNPL